MCSYQCYHEQTLSRSAVWTQQDERIQDLVTRDSPRVVGRWAWVRWASAKSCDKIRWDVLVILNQRENVLTWKVVSTVATLRQSGNPDSVVVITCQRSATFIAACNLATNGWKAAPSLDSSLASCFHLCISCMYLSVLSKTICCASKHSFYFTFD